MLHRPSTPVSSVIKAEYSGGMATAKDATYPTLPSRKKETLRPKDTVAASLRSTTVAAKLQEASTETKPWKMKKFEAVKSRLVTDPATE